MTCEQALTLIEPAIEDQLEPSVVPEFSRHIAVCANCAAELARAKAFVEELERVPVPEPPADLADRVKFSVRREAARIRRARIAGWVCGLGLPTLFVVMIYLFFPGGFAGFWNEATALGSSWWKTAGQAASDPSGKGLLARFRDALPVGLAGYWQATLLSLLGLGVLGCYGVYRTLRKSLWRRSGS
ncbi:MAG: hypothetical protein HRF45_12090 [Fimbriimonadia bacterium]|jgi:hypothetical protein